MRKIPRVPLLVLIILLTLSVGLAQQATGEVMTLTFTKEDPDGDNIWDGTLTGDTEGSVQAVLLNADQSQPVWRVAFEGIVTAGEQSFRAHVGGTLDSTTGVVRMTGVVTAGSMLGAPVIWKGQMVDQEASRFEGTITIMPTGGSGEGSSMPHMAHAESMGAMEHGDAHGEASEAPAELDTETMRMTEHEHFVVSYTSSPETPPLNQLHTWTLHVETSEGAPVENAEITVTGDMPQHGHGLPTSPQVTQHLGNGDYLIEGMKFHMPGWWTVDLTVRQGEITDTVTFDLLFE